MRLATAHDSADIAPVTGVYELLDPVTACSTTVRVPVFAGTTFPAVPPGWQWRLAEGSLPGD